MIPLETITSHASEFPERIVLREGGQEVTWDDFRTMVAAIRDWASRRLDPAQENKAVAFAGNTVPLVVAVGAMATLGIPWVGIDPARDWATVRAQFGAVSPTVALVDSSLPNGDAVAELARERRVLTLDLARAGAPIPGVTPFGTAVAGPGPRAEWTRLAFLALGFTSGTTGTPKLFARRARAENQRLAYLRDHFGFGRNDTYLVTSPLAHASGHVWANAALALGATVLLGGPDPDWIADTVAARGVTGMFVVPPVLDAFLRCACDRPDADLSSLRALLTGGRQVSAWSVRAAARRLGEVLHVYYATTETGINTFACPGDLAVAPLSAGVALPDVRLLVVDPVTHADMPTGQTGLIAVSSP